MSTYSKSTNIYSQIVLILVFVNAVVFKLAFLKHKQWYGVLAITMLVLIFAAVKHKQAICNINSSGEGEGKHRS